MPADRTLDKADRTPGGAVVRGQVGDFVRDHERRRRQLPRAIVLGLLAGLVATAFRSALQEGDRLRRLAILTAEAWGPAGVLVPVTVGAAGAAVAVLLVRRYAPEAAGSGIPHLKAVLRGIRPLRAAPLLAVKFVAGVIAIGSGLALGREGPTIQMGGAIGHLVSGWFRCTPREQRTLVAAGAGAGLAAAFNAPLAGLVFVLEEVERRFAAALFTLTLVASILADVVARALTGQLPVFHVVVTSPPALEILPVALALGGGAGVLGVAFNRCLRWTLEVFDRARAWPPTAMAGAVGGFAGLIGWFWPALPGSGQGLVEQALVGGIGPLQLLHAFATRLVLTIASYATGAPGGIFAPLLILGSELGAAAALLLGTALPAAGDHGTTLAVVGMTALFSAVVRAPLTGIVLMVEMTASYALILPLLAASLAAFGVADFLGDQPIYEALLERDLTREGPTATLERTMLVEVAVDSNAPWEGQRVDQLGLPAGCVLVAVRRHEHDLVPTAGFVLRAGDHVTAVVAPEAAAAVALLHRGTTAA